MPFAAAAETPLRVLPPALAWVREESEEAEPADRAPIDEEEAAEDVAVTEKDLRDGAEMTPARAHS